MTIPADLATVVPTDLEGPMARFEREIELDRSREEIFDFFAAAENLEQLTPAWLRFRILSATPIHMRPGARIDYQIRFRCIPLRWTSVISAWDPPHRFVDEQVVGPYRRWVHEHLFEETARGTRVRDRVEYAVPGGWIVDRLVVRRDLDRIFHHRHEQLRARFG